MAVMVSPAVGQEEPDTQYSQSAIGVPRGGGLMPVRTPDEAELCQPLPDGAAKGKFIAWQDADVGGNTTAARPDGAEMRTIASVETHASSDSGSSSRDYAGTPRERCIAEGEEVPCTEPSRAQPQMGVLRYPEPPASPPPPPPPPPRPPARVLEAELPPDIAPSLLKFLDDDPAEDEGCIEIGDDCITSGSSSSAGRRDASTMGVSSFAGSAAQSSDVAAPFSAASLWLQQTDAPAYRPRGGDADTWALRAQNYCGETAQVEDAWNTQFAEPGSKDVQNHSAQSLGYAPCTADLWSSSLQSGGREFQPLERVEEGSDENTGGIMSWQTGSSGTPQNSPSVTTLMISSVPLRYSSEDFQHLLDSNGLTGTYDFFFMPTDKRSLAHMGLAIINFCDPSYVPCLFWALNQCGLDCHVEPAQAQGYENSVALWGGSGKQPITTIGGNPRSSPQIKGQLRKTKFCAFYKKNKCILGQDCPFAHSKDELQVPPDLSKTKLCYNYFRSKCHNSDCKFAHGYEELRATDNVYKTELCRWSTLGWCKAGKACRYAHTMEELRGTSRATFEAQLQQAAP